MVLGCSPYFVFCGAGIAVRRKGAAAGQQKVGAGFCPQKGVWQPLAASQVLCLPHPRVGKIVSSRLSDSIRTAGRCGTVSSAFFRYPIASPYQWQTRGETAVKPCRVGTTLPCPERSHTAAYRGKQRGNCWCYLFLCIAYQFLIWVSFQNTQQRRTPGSPERETRCSSSICFHL